MTNQEKNIIVRKRFNVNDAKLRRFVARRVSALIGDLPNPDVVFGSQDDLESLELAKVLRHWCRRYSLSEDEIRSDEWGALLCSDWQFREPPIACENSLN